ncbi:GmrSD restriction endonuclease domain-containing protein [Sorangium sp. So ce388]|uniref:GmrSD restriction endonuclease domain-containing protein n=1 Tax=Sorangium sp. So ce388 TaxID=3133309 RepID=UPI003F5CB76B
MTARRQPAKARAAAKAVAPAAPAPPPRERFVPDWARDRHRSVHGSPIRLGTLSRAIARGDFRLPRFQRPWRWSDDDVLALLDSLLAGYHTGELLLWERYGLPASTERFGEIEVAAPAGRGCLVVDGQQRLGAIATAALGPRFALHLLDGRFAVGAAGPWWCPVGIIIGWTGRAIDWIRGHAAEHGLDEEHLIDAFGPAVDALDGATLYTVTFENGWPLDRVIESYRRLNTTGVRMSPEDLEAGLRRAVEER